MRVLIVEDDTGIADLIESMFIEYGDETRIVARGEEARECIVSWFPAFVILDFGLPDTTGGELIHTLMQDAVTIPPFVVSTGQGDERVAVDMMRLGARDYVVKDATFLEILPEVIKRVRRDIEGEERRKAVERELRIKESAIASSVDAILITDLKGVPTYVNKAFLELFGYAHEDEVLGRPASDFLTPPSQVSFILATLTRDGVWKGDIDVKRKDGNISPARMSATVVKNESGTPLCFMASLVDVSEEKLEERIRKAFFRIIAYTADHSLNEVIRNFLDEAEALTESSIGFFHFVEDDQVTLTLQTWSTNTLMRMCNATGVGEHYPISRAGVWVDCVRKRRPVIHNDYQSLSNKRGLPEGHAPIIRELVVPVFREGVIKAIFGIGNKQTNYTERDLNTLQHLADLVWETVVRSRAEEALEASERKYRRTIETSSQGFAYLDENFRIVYVNQALARMTGYMQGELVGKTPFDFVTEQGKGTIFHDREEQKNTKYSIDIRRKDGTVFPALIHVTHVPEDGDVPAETFAFFTDLTQLKETERALQESEEKFRAIFYNAPLGIFRSTTEGRFIEVNPALAKMLGYDAPDDVLACISNIAEQIYVKTNKREGIVRRALEAGEIQVFENVYRRKNGEHFIAQLYLRAITDDDGTTLYLEGMVEDITERKEMERQLIESEKRFRYAIAGANEGLWDWDLRTDDVYFSERWFTMLGYTPDEFSPHLRTWEALIHPDDLPDARRALTAQMKGESEYYEKTIRMRTKEGGWKWILDRGKVVERDEKGNAIRMTGTHTDIDEQHRLEEQVRRDLEEKKRSIARAQALQKRLTTQALPSFPDILISALYMPSEELSGDFINILYSGSRKVVFLIGDCSGHGIESSMEATLLKSVCDRHVSYLEVTDETDAFLVMVNEDFKNYSIEEKYPTLLVAVLDIQTKTFAYSNANAPLPVVIKDATSEALPRVHGFHLGFEENISFDRNEVSLGEEARLILYSDALYEFEDTQGRIFGEERLARLLPTIPGRGRTFIRNILDTLTTLAGRIPLEDDLTLIVIETNTALRSSKTVYTADELETCRTTLAEMLARYGYSKDEIDKVSVVLHELGVNAITHGNKQDPAKCVTIEIALDYEAFSMTITDEGEGFTREDVRDPTDFNVLLAMLEEDDVENYTHGRGIWLSEEYMDSVAYNERGNSVTACLSALKNEIVFYGHL